MIGKPPSKKGSVLGKCHYPFLSLSKCYNCKKFDECHDLLVQGQTHAKFEDNPSLGDSTISFTKDKLLEKEAWKDVSFNSYRGKQFLMKLQSKRTF